jgi:hypothetical protein
LELPSKTRENPKANPKLTTSHHKSRTTILSTGDWSDLYP